jgi:hypothetical protein
VTLENEEDGGHFILNEFLGTTIFTVENGGGVTLRDFRVTVYIPAHFKISLAEISRNPISESTISFDGISYRAYQILFQQPFFAGDRISIAPFRLRAEPGNYKFLWRIQCDEGTFPLDAPYGQLQVQILSMREVMEEAHKNLFSKDDGEPI